MLRNHTPIVKEDFNGLWKRGDAEAAPFDHESDNNNVQFQQSAVKTRDGLETYEAYNKVLRIYTYTYLIPPDSFESLLILTEGGTIYHDASPNKYTPILTVPGMVDFGFVSITGRAFITPNDGKTGLAGESIYIYKGDGSLARKMGGAPPSGTLSLAIGSSGNVEAGVHVLAVAYETDTGFITQISAFAYIAAPGATVISVSSIPISSDPFVVARRLVATLGIDPTLFSGDLASQYQFFFIPDGRIADNTTTTLDVSFYDAELLEDASYLLNLFTHVPAAVGLTTYHNRLVSFCEHDNISLARVSGIGTPEAIDQVSGLLIIPLDSNALTNGIAFRDVLYMYKSTRSFAYVDNGGVPAGWPLTVIDSGIGASIHGIGTVLDSEAVNIDYLLIVDYSGIMLFNGSYIRPELTFKIRDLWTALDRTAFSNIQIMNDSIKQVIYVTLPNKQMLIADYSNGLDFKDVRFANWTFNIETTTITMVEFNKLIIGSKSLAGAP